MKRTEQVRKEQQGRKEELKQQLKQIIRKELRNYHYLNDWFSAEEILEELENADFYLEDFKENMQDRILEREIIYYDDAMKFLMEEDNSLRESLEIAYDYGYECKDLSSEILATILLQERLRGDLDDFINELENNNEFNQIISEIDSLKIDDIKL